MLELPDRRKIVDRNNASTCYRPKSHFTERRKVVLCVYVYLPLPFHSFLDMSESTLLPQSLTNHSHESSPKLTSTCTWGIYMYIHNVKWTKRKNCVHCRTLRTIWSEWECIYVWIPWLLMYTAYSLQKTFTNPHSYVVVCVCVKQMGRSKCEGESLWRFSWNWWVGRSSNSGFQTYSYRMHLYVCEHTDIREIDKEGCR